MNKYDNKIFKQHYGQLYYRVMYWGLGLALLCLQLAYYPTLFKWNISETYIGILGTLIILLLVAVGVCGYLYFVCQKKAKNQQVWIDKNKVYYRIEKKQKQTMHTYTYKIQKVDAGSMDNRFIHVKGRILVTDETDNALSHNNVSEVLIPRCFTNEDKVKKALQIV